MKIRKILALALALIMVLALAACGNSKPAETAPKADTPKAETPATEALAPEAPKNTPTVATPEDNGKYGGVLKVAVNHDITNLGVPQKNLTFQAALVADCCLEHLCRNLPRCLL